MVVVVKRQCGATSFLRGAVFQVDLEVVSDSTSLVSSLPRNILSRFGPTMLVQLVGERPTGAEAGRRCSALLSRVDLQP